MAITTLGEIIRHQRRERPDKVALVYASDDRKWTFAELDHEACQCANALQEMGVEAQDRIAYLDKNTPEYFTYLFGASKLNAVTVAVNWRLAAPEMEYILHHSQAKVLLIGEEFLPLLKDIKLSLEHVVVLGDPGDSAYPSYQQWIGDQPGSDPAYPADPDDTCFQLYTSGTTGLPKGVESSHSNLISGISGSFEALNYSDSSVNQVCMPLFHIAGSGWAMIGFIAGATTILLKEANMQEILRTIPSHSVSHSLFVPAVLKFLLDEPGVQEVDFTSLQVIVYGASPISEQVLIDSIETFQANFYGVYGLTETTGSVTRLEPCDHDPGGPKAELLRSVGKPSNGHDIKIMNTETGTELSDGEVGEIWIRGPQVMRGYWRDEKATAEAIDTEGWFRSGDVGYKKDAYLYIHDRVKDMIISGAENIYPAEIENVLMAHPGVADVAVIGVPDEDWGEAVKALICRSDPGLGEAELIAYCRQRIAHYKCPSSIDWLEQLPRNPSGKILKTELRKPYWQGRDRKV
ncbi:MAG: long-chain-fatty-acid--CoA ligase [Proteobacteria bacterium]|nr:long-chain-fatty-acid--CoA ligase [Pseudomonadota bacterium]